MRKRQYLVLVCLFSLLLMLNSPVSAQTELLKKGASGDQVANLQRKLVEYGYLSDSPDGKFGDNTWEAVVHFQLDCGIDADGVVGDKTWQYINNFKSLGISVSRGGDRLGQQITSFAKRFMGTPYVWGGKSPSGFDCSGFITYVYGHFGLSLPRMADEQFNVGVHIANKSQLQPGDMVFFTTYEPGPSHVGIYLGNGQFIHASSGAGGVVITPLAKQFYAERYLGGRRVLR